MPCASVLLDAILSLPDQSDRCAPAIIAPEGSLTVPRISCASAVASQASRHKTRVVDRKLFSFMTLPSRGCRCRRTTANHRCATNTNIPNPARIFFFLVSKECRRPAAEVASGARGVSPNFCERENPKLTLNAGVKRRRLARAQRLWGRRRES